MIGQTVAQPTMSGKFAPANQSTQLRSTIAVRPLVRPDEPSAREEDRKEHPREAPSLRLVRPADSGEQQPLDLVFPAPNPFVPTLVETTPSPRMTARPASIWNCEQTDDEFFERQPTRREHLPEPRAWAQRYGQAWVEAWVGRRPAKQLSRWSTPGVLAGLQHHKPESSADGPPRSPLHQSTQPPPVPARAAQAVVSGIRVDEPADGVAEVAAVVRSRGRSRALMLRLEGWDGRWICTYAAML